jgi:hypothetical protein
VGWTSTCPFEWHPHGPERVGLNPRARNTGSAQPYGAAATICRARCCSMVSSSGGTQITPYAPPDVASSLGCAGNSPCGNPVGCREQRLLLWRLERVAAYSRFPRTKLRGLQKGAGPRAERPDSAETGSSPECPGFAERTIDIGVATSPAPIQSAGVRLSAAGAGGVTRFGMPSEIAALEEPR